MKNVDEGSHSACLAEAFGEGWVATGNDSSE